MSALCTHIYICIYYVANKLWFLGDIWSKNSIPRSSANVIIETKANTQPGWVLLWFPMLNWVCLRNSPFFKHIFEYSPLIPEIWQLATDKLFAHSLTISNQNVDSGCSLAPAPHFFLENNKRSSFRFFCWLLWIIHRGIWKAVRIVIVVVVWAESFIEEGTERVIERELWGVEEIRNTRGHKSM